MLFKASSRANIAGTLIVIMMAILLLVPQPAHAEQANGEYTIGFNIMHADKKNASIAEGYWDQPAKVFIKDGSIRVQTTINKHAWVTKFAISYNGSMSEVKTLSVDEATNVRITEFQVTNLSDLVESNVSVTIGEIDYEHSYTMYFKFKPETLALVKAEEPQTSTQSTTPAPVQEPADQVEGQKENPTPAPTLDPAPAPTETAAEQSDKDSASQVGQSDQDIAAAGDEGEETIDVAGQAGSTEQEQPGSELGNVSQQEQDASEPSATEQTAVSDIVPAEQTLEEDSNGSNITLVIVIILVLIAIIAFIVYRTRHNKKSN